jgi:hypothetical protein
MFILGPWSWIWIFFNRGSRIQGSKSFGTRIPDPRSLIGIRNTGYVFLFVTKGAANYNFLKIITRDSQMKPVATQKGGQESVNWCAEPKKWSFINLIYILYVEQNSIGILVCQKMDRIVTFLDICWMIGVLTNKFLLYNSVWYTVATKK